MTTAVQLRWMTASDSDVDDVVTASHLFDHDVQRDWAEKFLDDPNHHLCIAYDDGGEPAGFVTGVETTHPDKGTEMFLYELGVDERYQGKGIGRALVEALATKAQDRGCYGMWVVTESDNDAALATYTSAGANERDDNQVMLGWRFG